MTTTRTARGIAALAGLALVVAACSSGDDGADTAVESADAVVVETEEPAADDTDTGSDSAGTNSDGAAPQPLQFEAELVGGGDIDLAASFDGKPTLLWFWAPWCGICNTEAPSIEQAAQQYGDEVDFVGVAWAGSEDQFQGFVDSHGLTFPQISDDPGLIYDRFGVAFQPAMVVVQPDGTLERLSGSLDSGTVEEIIAQSA